MIRLTLAAIAVAIAMFAIGCPPNAAVVNRPRVPLAPKDYKVVNCQLQVDPPAGTGTHPECYHESQYRSAHSLNTCPGGESLENGLCYRSCQAGYSGNGPVCWKDCPAGYRDDGVTCRRDLSIVRAERHGCPWYDVCGVTFARGCTKCPEGYRNDGCTCVRDVRIIGQDAEGRGVGTIPGCRADQEKIGLLCYDACPQGSNANGFMCEANAQTCVEVPDQPWPSLQTFCVKTQSDGFCSVHEIAADTADNAVALAACACTNCSVEQIDCNYSQTVCR